ncbi:MAG: hypothetical protein LCI03_01470 [Actinobacteria bacterium]|nr:hypothetical protein [Actinomycetota bacterium]
MHVERTASAAQRVEHALRVVPGVLEASVRVGDSAGNGTEVHLVLDDSTDQAAVARAVHSMLRLQFGVGLDHDEVDLVMDITDTARGVTALPRPRPDAAPAGGHAATSSGLEDDGADLADVVDLGIEIDGLIAELDRRSGRDFDVDVLAAAARHPSGSSTIPEQHAAPPQQIDLTDDEVRLSIARLSVIADHHRAQATVALLGPRGEVRGSADGGSTDTAVLETIALATLRAVAALVECEDGFSVSAVSTPMVGDHEVAVVQVECCLHGEVERLTGASEVRDDVHQAVIRATLDAVNRRLPLLTPAP